jgi:hypothetical protein
VARNTAKDQIRFKERGVALKGGKTADWEWNRREYSDILPRYGRWKMEDGRWEDKMGMQRKGDVGHVQRMILIQLRALHPPLF